MVAWHGCWEMWHGEPMADERGTQCVGGRRSRHDRRRDAREGPGERPRIEADRAGCACKASRVDAWALR